jgi:glyceraldehyde-3-phosphate dehydrogenase/erythrose-4-phosphate dehydrogenase
MTKTWLTTCTKNTVGRAAALNMVITETGAGTAVAKALPSLEGKLTLMRYVFLFLMDH